MCLDLSILEENFSEARLRVLGKDFQTEGIGGLNEKALHRILKLTIEPREEKHEVKYLGSVVDILNEHGVTEIQTRSLSRLRPKLERLLPTTPVRLVYPIPAVKYLRWINMKSGEITERRRVSKRSTVYDSYRELWRMRSLLPDKNLTVTLLLLEVEEYRTLDGWDESGKRGSTRFERIPEKLLGAVSLNTPKEYANAFLPEDLSTPFTVKEYAEKIRQKPRWAYQGIRILMDLGVLSHTGERGREFLYAPVDSLVNG